MKTNTFDLIVMVLWAVIFVGWLVVPFHLSVISTGIVIGAWLVSSIIDYRRSRRRSVSI